VSTPNFSFGGNCDVTFAQTGQCSFLKNCTDPIYCVQRVDGAVDFELEKLGYLTLVCARRWKAARTGIEPLRELAELREKRSARECHYAVAGELTEQARAFAKQKGVKLVEGAELARLVRG
jgi:restriction system protein